MAKTFYRMTISIPQRLKEQMDALEVPVNWSALAAQAFQAKVTEVSIRRKKELKMADVIERLKATEVADAQEDYAEGKQAGRDWAQRKATKNQLRRAYDFVHNDPKPPYVAWWDVGDPSWGGQSGPPDHFASAVLPSRKDEPGATREFWEAALDDEADRAWEANFLRGFGEGAAEAWEEVRHAL